LNDYDRFHGKHKGSKAMDCSVVPQLIKIKTTVVGTN
jgi:hypothetical protein